MTKHRIDKIVSRLTGGLLIASIGYIMVGLDWAWEPPFNSFVKERIPALAWLVTEVNLKEIWTWVKRRALGLNLCHKK